MKCPLCGKIKSPFDTSGLWWDCTPTPFEYEGTELLDGIHVSFLYAGRLKQAVEVYKYEGVRSYSEAFAAWMVQEGRSFLETHEIDLVTAIPLSKERERMRGYNQSELIARELAQLIGKPYAETILRTRDTMPLKTLGREMRKEQLLGAFEAAKELKGLSGHGVKILLVDDILTTGSTLTEARRVILEAAPDAKVYGWTLCQDILARPANQEEKK